MRSGFSERTFEFCFNAEYCKLHEGLLASYPHIPSQRLEKALGYDVEFRIRQSHYTKSIFFQHKVPYFVETLSGKNAHFYTAHNGPYFRFAVDNEQHNILCELSRTQGNAFYSAPVFYLRSELETHFRATTVTGNSIRFDPNEVGDIFDNNLHNITYGPAGGNPTIHPKIPHFGGSKNPLAPELKTRPIDDEYIEELSETLVRRSEDQRFITQEFQRRSSVERVQILLGRVYKISWLLLP